MPISPTYPGVYVEELPSGVRTITGVSTSVTAFIGGAKRGPINKAVPVRSWADYERRYGGLAVDSPMSYAVRQFFVNGGTEAIVIRVAAGAAAATGQLKNGGGAIVLDISAADDGQAGNSIEIQVAYGTSSNTFTLSAILPDPVNPAGTQRESFPNLTMNSKDPRYVETVINGSSKLITVKRHPGLSFVGLKGSSTSGDLSGAPDVATKLDANHREFVLSVNGLDPITVDTGAIAGPDLETQLNNLGNRIVAEANAKGSGAAYTGLTFDLQDNKKRIRIISGADGEDSTVRIYPSPSRDASGVLKLGAASGGSEVDAVSSFRPAIAPTPATITSTKFVAGDLATKVPDAGKREFKLTLDGGNPTNVDLGIANVVGADILDKTQKLAQLITTTVRGLGNGDAFKNFVAGVDAANPAEPKLTLSSGTAGLDSRIKVETGAQDVLALLHFGNGDNAQGTVTKLAGGNDLPVTDANIGTVLPGSRAQRKGLYALESVDIFNLLCIPGVIDSSILAESVAYCEERRAFFIADAPPGKGPDDMKTEVQGPRYPKKKNIAVYYPWVGIPDPLQGGVIRNMPPSGTLAGVFARTDSTRGVWKAPAGVDAALGGVQQVEYVLTDGENGALNPQSVDCIRMFPTYGPVSWGARTLSIEDDWRYVPVRRLALFIEESLYRGTKWAVFEPNDEPLWAQLRMNIGAFMHNLFRQGAFAGTSPRDAYLVKCDKETTTQADVNLGIVNVLIGFAPLKPAEFVFLKIQQLAGQLQS